MRLMNRLAYIRSPYVRVPLVLLALVFHELPGWVVVLAGHSLVFLGTLWLTWSVEEAKVRSM